MRPTAFLAAGLLLAAILPLQAQHQHEQPAAATRSTVAGGVTVVEVPAEDPGAETLEQRAAGEREVLQRSRIRHDFRFADRQPESGITFVHRIVDDAGKTYKAAHYDHGNGVAVADIDGDQKLDVYFTTQLGRNELWRNLGGGRFEDVTAAAGVALTDRIAVSASFADVDNDGDADLYVTTVRHGNVLFANDGRGRFREVTAEAGLSYVGHSSAALFFDYDRDGWLDLYLLNVGKFTSEQQGRGGFFVAYEPAFDGHLFPQRSERSVLYRNLGGLRFADVTEQTGLIDLGWSGDATTIDFDEDGWQDLYVLNMQGDDHYWRNEQGRRFVEDTARHFPQTPWGAMGVKVFDADNDGRQDLLVTDMHSDMVGDVPPQNEKSKFTPVHDLPALQGIANNVFGNAFYHNLGGGRFAERSDPRNLENYWPWGLSVDDLNADGFQDVLITASMNYPFRYGVNSVLLNDGRGGFLDAASVLGVEPRRGGATKTPWFSLDCSGDDRAHRECKDHSGPVEVRGTLGSRSSAIFDLDDDGDLDLITAELNSAPQVLISDLAARHPIRWLKVRLVGRRSNRDGLGAVVRVVAGDLVQVKVNDGNSGYLSHSVMPLYFGLAAAGQADRIEVTWPSGERQVIPGPLPANQTVEVSEPPPAR